MSEDFYDILGVGRDADQEEIEQAYREKASEYHPDVSDDPNAEEKFKKAKKAKEVLTDDQKRQQYDRLGHDQFEEAEKRGAFDGQGGAGAGRAGAGGMGGNPFGGGGGGAGGSPFGDIFEQFFGGGGRGGSRSRQGADLRTELELDLEEAYRGVDKQVTIKRPETCPECDGQGHPPDSGSQQCPQCNGRGQVRKVQQTPLGRVQQTRPCRQCNAEGTIYDETCSECRGEGTVRREATLTVEVPSGIKDGQTLRMGREGAPGENGGPNGDLLIDVSIADHPDYEREDDDLHYRLPISFPQAVFGDTVEIPTFDESVELEIPAGTQSGERFTIDDEGMPRLRGRRRGDLHVTVQVVTPENINEDQRDALEAYAEAGGEEIQVEQGFFEKIKSTF